LPNDANGGLMSLAGQPFGEFMDLPILEKLKDGVKFDFATLADNVEKADLFWDWWWKEKWEKGTLDRPETIEDQDESHLLIRFATGMRLMTRC
jgi:hypothetical protein